jgi:NADPH:quinone reductase-like Zn-dependent oxidoreductase
MTAMHGIDLDSHGSILTTAAELIEAGKLFVHVSKIYDLADLAQGHAQQETGKTTGKLAVKVK